MSSILRTWGWLPWSNARETVGAAAAVWLAPDRVATSEALPETMPQTQRIDAWSQDDGGRPLWRLLPNRAEGLVLVTGLLPAATDSAIPTTGPHAKDLQVEVEITSGPQWQEHRVTGVAPIMFLRPRAEHYPGRTGPAT